MTRLPADVRQAIREVLLEEDEVVKRITLDAANEPCVSDEALAVALASRPWWWFPRYVDQQASRAGWRSFADRRSRFAVGMFRLAALTAVIALALPDQAGRWMFIAFGLVIAMVWAWQSDVANDELSVIAALPERPSLS